MRPDLNPAVIAARRSSDLTFAKTKLSMGNEANYTTVLSGFHDAALYIIRNIPEIERTEEDHLRIMCNYQHAMQFLTSLCEGKISLHQMYAARADYKDSMARVTEIIDILNRLTEIVRTAENYLQYTQSNGFNIDLNFYLSAMTGLSNYYEHTADWLQRSRDLPSKCCEILNRTHMNPVQFAETMFTDILYRNIQPKIDMMDAIQLRELTNCHHAVTNIYKYRGSVEKCVQSGMSALIANNSIQPNFKTNDDMTKFLTIFVSITCAAYKRNAMIENIANLGHDFFGGAAKRANPEFLESLVNTCAANGTLFELQFLIETMRVIKDNYQRAPYPSNLQQALSNPSYQATFTNMMSELERRTERLTEESSASYTPRCR